MKRKWFQLVGEDGKALTSATSLSVDAEDVDTLRKAVFAEVSRALPATVIAADLTVFASRAAYSAKQKLPKSSSSVAEYGNDEDNSLIVQAPSRESGGAIVSAVSPNENERSFQKFNARVEHSKLEHQGGVPSTYTTYRTDTVKAFASLLDRIPATYDDELLWLGYLKATLDGGFPGMRFVLFSSYGSFDIYIVIPPANTIGLNATQLNPGLYLSRVELEDMVQSSINGKIVSDLIWILCSGHIGIARAILLFLQTMFGTIPRDAEDIEMELRSERLLQNIRSDYRSIPTADAFRRVIRAHDLSEEAKQKMIEVMNGVASGKPMLSSDGERTSRSRIAVELLTKFGFLYEDQTQQLQFASSMHFKIWLYSNRTDPIGYMISDVSHDDFVIACVKRMSASRLQHFACGNTRSIARERQIQMELYGATVSCLPRDVLVTPEWRTNDGKGFIDLVIRGSSILSFWELLVNGDDAVGHSKRFETGGTYHGSLTGSSRYVLIDFRQNKGVRHQKLGFLYVSFVDSFTTARIFGLGKPAADVELSK
ncbi:TPA: hypothetical protein N0F65_009733 [Lagenidium giganteum]|uniref:Uncharacterized protein n=1 Tax=Lagenidium giganteum TaxID=4803 RepID=A0AAV2YK34_9STRA|nr:TPA: hypothetical protein N0F65_009733 [Lagenidium giganteum]